MKALMRLLCVMNALQVSLLRAMV